MKIRTIIYTFIALLCLSASGFGASSNLPEPLRRGEKNKKNPITPENYFLFRLQNTDSTLFKKWDHAYIDYYYRLAKKKGFQETEQNAQYTTATATPIDRKKIFKQLKKKRQSYNFDDEANFVLFDEYVRLHPDSGKMKNVTVEKLIKNELKYLTKIYLVEPVDRVIRSARTHGAGDSLLADLLNLRREIIAFDRLSAMDEAACDSFLTTYSSSSKTNLIRKAVFEIFEKDYTAQADTTLIPKLVKWVPAGSAAKFYAAIWERLHTAAQGKTSADQLHLLRPWITSTPYRYATLEEKIFLAELLSWAAVLHMQEKNTTRTALSNMTAAAIIHTSYRDLTAKLFENMFSDLDFSNMGSWQRRIEQKKRRVQQAQSNIRTSRKLLYSLGLASFYSGTFDFLARLSQAQSEDEEEKGKALEAARQKLVEIAGKDDAYKESCRQLLLQVFEEDNNAWPALQAFSVFPDKEPMESIVLMPRFYDYEDDIETYLSKFKEESIALAYKWLADPDASKMQKARAFFILGFQKSHWTKNDSTNVPDLGNYDYFYDYYALRVKLSDSTAHKNNLLKAAAEKNRIALVLYNRTKGSDATPEALRDWLVEIVDEKKYQENVTKHIYQPIIAGLSVQDKSDMINKMYNSYNFAWRELADIYYKQSIPDTISDIEIRKVMNGAVPWKKAALLTTLTKRDSVRYTQFAEKFLLGGYYTKGDRDIIRRNLENMFTKDITVGYNERINWSVVNKAVNQAEVQYRAMITLSAVEALDILPFDIAVAVIKGRFLTDDFLCLKGADWILENYDPDKHARPDFSSRPQKSTKLQKAAYTLLESRFSEKQDYKKYAKAANKLKKDDKWPQLISLGAKYLSKDMFKEEQTNTQAANPVEDWGLDTLLSNIKGRLLTLVNKAGSEVQVEKN